jgi:hypothetical protein
VITQIKEDVINHDLDALEELLSFLPAEKLIRYLPEELNND